MWQLRGTNAVVTGAAAGIGRALALALAREGANLYLVDIDGIHLLETVAQARIHGVEVIGHRCDIARSADLRAMIQELRQHWPHIDVLVNNAGVLYEGPTEGMSEGQWDRLLQINVMAPLQLIRELLPALLERERAHILNVCSIAGLIGFARVSAYSASKFALVGFSEALRAEYEGRSLGVTALCPGFVHTSLLSNRMRPGDAQAPRLPPARLCISPDEVARHAVRAIRVNRGLVVFPWWARVLWGVHRMSPGLLPFLTRTSNSLSRTAKRLCRRRPGNSGAGCRRTAA
jgi:short-subunit dehydrogenase